MSQHLQMEIDKLKKQILYLGALVEEAVQKAGKAVISRDAELATKVIESDEAIDRMEVELEEECLKVLALYQPVATDLRYIVAILKINNDLERIGDLAVNAAEEAQAIARLPSIPIPPELVTMAEQARTMLKNALDAFVNLDLNLANQVCQSDDIVDDLDRKMNLIVTAAIRQDLDQTEAAASLLLISRHLERIADHATNIAQDVIYLHEGEIVRHRFKALKT
jgi:phosphate transport system protein